MNDRDEDFNSLLEHLAILVIGEGLNPSETDRIYDNLRQRSNNLSVIDEVIDWLKGQNSSGNLRQTLEFLFQSPFHQRYHENFLITGLVPDHVRLKIESLRLKGVLTESMCEQIYASALSADAMIWTEDELEQIIVDLCRDNPSGASLSLPLSLDLKTDQFFHS